MGKMFSQEQLRHYASDGFLFPIEVLTPDEVVVFRAAVEDLEERVEARHKGPLISECHLNFRWAYDLVTHPVILDAVEDIIGPNILVHSASIFSKAAYDPRFVSWHQDGHYWHLSTPLLVSAWIALSDSTIENGCMRVIPGTHKTRLDHAAVMHEDNMLRSGNTVVPEVDESRAVNLVLKAGEMSLHHVNTLHGSKPNRSAGKRIGFAIRYMATEVSQVADHYEVVLARGRDTYHHYTVLERRPSDDVEEGYAAQMSFVRRLQELRASVGRSEG